MLKNDKWIIEQAKLGMISPFESSLVREIEDRRVISYGLSSYGYDLRLSPTDFRIFRHIPGTVVNPKRFNSDNLESIALQTDEDGSFFIIPANSYALGVSLERLRIPANITVICIGKSTMARCGIIANITPAEASWEGFLTLEFSNASSADCRIYANEGVLQLLFLEGEPCQTTYAERFGKYQNQPQTVTIAKV
ncbi:dCTP deaminase [Nodularia sp. NIES-3585]|uniref:dCTP deaminase n=1 Tax=Nodularia sp. NIES-3585 TaxID=1973477 RepID=UPI000B5C6BD9|nr:dCTP deaminase [Nodularia sp. NIES-3585]GAX37707.1 deoxycytidine triphosphate deaminase [Nodularia sp. NIES-3585]